MNILERTRIEKTADEHGWENILSDALTFTLVLRWVATEHLSYLAWHRQFLFKAPHVPYLYAK